MSATSRIIFVKKMDNGPYEEGEADAEIYPGEAIVQAADGNFDPTPAAQAAALKETLFIATEELNLLFGKTARDAYADGDTLSYRPVRAGDVVNILVKTGEDIDVGDALVVEGGGSGLFVEAAGTETKFNFRALEDSGGALAADTLIKCRCTAP